MTEILVCIDDTDNLESPGTGHLAEILRSDIEKLYKGKTSRITRHQLFVSPEIPYTSHNSAMCFTAEMDIKYLNEMIAYAGKFLEEKSAGGSDPGLCVAVNEHIKDKERLVRFGLDATRTVLTKNDAVRLAEELNIHLSEHGGTGGGIIGALSGVGLRLYGSNGRFKGWLPVKENDRKITIETLLKNYEIDEVRDISGEIPDPLDIITLDGRIKTVLLDGRSVLPVKQIAGDNLCRVNLSKDEIKKY
jgi:hypothetical protein